MTSPQGPWQQGQQYGGYQQYPQQPNYPQQAGYPHQGTPSGGFPQQQYVYMEYGAYPQQPGYPQANPYAAPAVSAQEMAGVARPTTVEVAFWIAVVVPLVVTVLTVANFLLSMELVNSIIATEIGAGEPGAEMARNVAGWTVMAGGIFMAVFYAVLTGLWILFGFKMRAGRNWARITLTVFAAIWCLSAVTGLIGGAGGAFGAGQLPAGVEMPTGMVVLSYTQAALGLLTMAAFLVLVYLKPSNWYFLAARYRQSH